MSSPFDSKNNKKKSATTEDSLVKQREDSDKDYYKQKDTNQLLFNEAVFIELSAYLIYWSDIIQYFKQKRQDNGKLTASMCDNRYS